MNSKKCYICLHETGNIRLEHDSLCRSMEPADGMVWRTCTCQAARREMCIRDRVIGILPQYRKEVIKDIILWKKSRYFIEEKPTSNKALAQCCLLYTSWWRLRVRCFSAAAIRCWRRMNVWVCLLYTSSWVLSLWWVNALIYKWKWLWLGSVF